MEVRAGLGVVTVGVLAGEIAASRWQPPPLLLLAPPLALLLIFVPGVVMYLPDLLFGKD